AQFTLGDASGNVATFVNAATGTYDLTTATGIGGGAANGLVFSNAGLLEMTGSGTSTIGINVTDTGQIAVGVGGVLVLGGATNSITGTVSGAGTLVLGGGTTTTLKPGTVLTTAALTMSGPATVNLNVSLAYAGAFTDAAGNSTSVISLAAGKKLA